MKSGKSRIPRYLPEELGCSFLEEQVVSSEKVIFCGSIDSILYNEDTRSDDFELLKMTKLMVGRKPSAKSENQSYDDSTVQK